MADAVHAVAIAIAVKDIQICKESDKFFKLPCQPIFLLASKILRSTMEFSAF